MAIAARSRLVARGFGLVAVTVLTTTPAPDGLAAPNSLLVLDENDDRVLYVPLGGGPVRVLSPPLGATENLLTSPSGIGTGPDGEVYVVNSAEGTIVFIDAATGAQFPVEDSSGPPQVGLDPHDVAVSPREPSPGFFRTLGVSALSQLHQVTQSSFDVTGSLLASFPAPYFGEVGRFVAAHDAGGDDALDYYVVTEAVWSVLRFDGSTSLFGTALAPANTTIHGLDVSPNGQLVASYRGAGCPDGANGLALLDIEANATDFHFTPCPGPVARGSDATYFVDLSVSPPLVKRFFFVGFETTVAALPAGTVPADMALHVPEPAATALGAVSCLATGALAARRRPFRPPLRS